MTGLEAKGSCPALQALGQRAGEILHQTPQEGALGLMRPRGVALQHVAVNSKHTFLP